MTVDGTASDYDGLRHRAAEFARDQIASRPGLHGMALPPPDLWRAFGTAGLTAVGLPPEHGGAGGDLRAIATVSEALAEQGGNLGLATSYMARQLSARLHVMGHGTAEQKAEWLPKLASGASTPCLAVSEPGAGAHPKHLKARAVRDGDGWVIDGEKAWTTNGPVADLVLLLAISGEDCGRKRFSVFLVPMNTPGVERTPGVEVDFLHPSPHCGLRLTDVRVPASSLLGPEGEAFEAISLPMRRTEDVIATASKAGALRHQVRRLAAEVADRPLDDDQIATIGRLAAAPAGLSALAWRAVELLDLDPDGNAEAAEAAAAAARDWIGGLQDIVRMFIESAGLVPSAALAAETRDIVKTTGIAGAAQAIRGRRRARTLIETARNRSHE